MKVLCVHYGRDLPSTRIRMVEMLPHLERRGVTSGVVGYPKSVRGLLRLARQGREWDLLWLQKRLPSFPAALILGSVPRPIVYDFDDAVCFRRVPRRGSYDSWRRSRRFSRITGLAAAVTCGNRFLADLLPRDGAPVLIYPSPVRTEVVQRSYDDAGEVIRLGWIGVGGNLDSLERIAPAVAEAGRSCALTLRVISDRAFSWPGIRVENVRWSAETQEASIAGIDVGLMPLDPASPFDRCKCSYKILQYMACGVAAVGSAVGMNADLIRDGRNGRLVYEERDWGRVLAETLRLGRRRLCELGAEGRRTVLDGFGYPLHAGRLADFFERVVTSSISFRRAGSMSSRGASVPVLAYHRVGPRERITPELFREHLGTLARCGLPSLGLRDLDSAGRGFLLTFDDGFVEVWTRVAELLEEFRFRAAVFAIPSRTGDGGPRVRGAETFRGSGIRAHREAVAARTPHPAFLRWSELRALEASGLVTVQSHSHAHAAAWVGDEICGFHLGPGRPGHWSLPECTGGDDRLGIPVYRRGSVLAHRIYRDDPALRDHLANWLARRGGAAYVAERGAERTQRELAAEASALRSTRSQGGNWESDDERRRRTVEDLAHAREALERELGGIRDELCLPWGEYDAVTLECARHIGIRRVYTLDRGPNPAGAPGFLVRRFEPRARGAWWLRTRMWIHRSRWRSRVYAQFSGGGRGGRG